MTTIPIAEHFHSVQGEGTYTGTPMHFIRLAGCNVGRHPEHVTWEIGRDRNFPILKTGHPAYLCHTYDNRPFWCDTDFHHGDPMEINYLLDDTWERHICLTGGEPFLHADKIIEIWDECDVRGVMLHFDTSGKYDKLLPGWITCSPKLGFHDNVIFWSNEVKLLIDKDFKLESIPDSIRRHENVFVQPINNELS